MATEKVLKEYDEGKKMEEALSSDPYQDTFESIMLNLAPAGLMVQGTKQLRKWFLKGLDNPKLMGNLMKVLGPADRKQVNKWLKSESKDIQKIHSKNIDSAEKLRNLKKPEYTMEDGVMYKNPQPKSPSIVKDSELQRWYKHAWDKNPLNPKSKLFQKNLEMKNRQNMEMSRRNQLLNKLSPKEAKDILEVQKNVSATDFDRWITPKQMELVKGKLKGEYVTTASTPRNMEVLREYFRDMNIGPTGVNPLRDLLGPIGLGTAAGAVASALLDEEQDPSGGEWHPPQTLPSPYEPGMSQTDSLIENMEGMVPMDMAPAPKFNPMSIIQNMTSEDEIF